MARNLKSKFLPFDFGNTPLTVRIKRRREALGMSQNDLAEKVGLPLPSGQISVWSWESGRALPHADVVCLLCIALGTTPNDLLGFDEWQKPEVKTPAKKAVKQTIAKSNAAKKRSKKAKKTN